jgi:hypothetical protein
MTDLELALKELKSATAAAAALSEDDYAEARAAMDRRTWALRDLAALAAQLPPADRDRLLKNVR